MTGWQVLGIFLGIMAVVMLISWLVEKSKNSQDNHTERRLTPHEMAEVQRNHKLGHYGLSKHTAERLVRSLVAELEELQNRNDHLEASYKNIALELSNLRNQQHHAQNKAAKAQAELEVKPLMTRQEFANFLDKEWVETHPINAIKILRGMMKLGLRDAKELLHNWYLPLLQQRYEQLGKPAQKRTFAGYLNSNDAPMAIFGDGEEKENH